MITEQPETKQFEDSQTLKPELDRMGDLVNHKNTGTISDALTENHMVFLTIILEGNRTLRERER